MCALIEARALEYAYHPGGATGLLVKDDRGKNAEHEIFKFDTGLISQMNATMKQAAIEEGQWSEKRDTARQANDDLVAKLNAGRQRVAEAKKRALAEGKPWFDGDGLLTPDKTTAFPPVL
jgi:hypothetical protein